MRSYGPKLRKAAAVFLLVLVLVPASGCGFKDLDKRFFVLAMGVDKGEDGTNYKVTIKLAVPSPKIEPGQENNQILTQQAKTVTEAVRLLKSKVDKEFEFGHMKMIVFGDGILQKNVPDVLDWFVRRRDIQKTAFVAYATPSAESVLRTTPRSERLPGNALFLSFGGEGTESAFIITEFLYDFYRRLKEQGLDPYLPVIEPDQAEQTYIIDRVALLDKKKCVAILTPDETRILNMLMKSYRKLDFEIKKDGQEYYVAIQDLKVNYRFNTPAGARPEMQVSLLNRGILEESDRAIYDTDWRELEQTANEQGVSRVEKLLQKLQKIGVDPIGFGLKYRATHLDTNSWQQWQEIYPDLAFRVKVRTRLEGTGVIK